MKLHKLKIKSLFISSFLLAFTGCSQSAFNYFDKNEPFVQNTQYTQVVKIVENETVKAIVNITYLNGADPKKWSNGRENFIVGKYIVDDKKGEYSLDLVTQRKKNIQLDKTNIEYEKIVLKPVLEKVIQKSDPIYNQIPFKNSWAEYTLVSYEDIKEGRSIVVKFTDGKQNFSQTTFIAK